MVGEVSPLKRTQQSPQRDSVVSLMIYISNSTDARIPNAHRLHILLFIKNGGSQCFGK